MNWNNLVFKQWLFVDAISMNETKTFVSASASTSNICSTNFCQPFWQVILCKSFRQLPISFSQWECMLLTTLWCCQQFAISSPLFASLLHSLLSLEDNSHWSNNRSFCNCRSFQQSLLLPRWHFHSLFFALPTFLFSCCEFFIDFLFLFLKIIYNK